MVNLSSERLFVILCFAKHLFCGDDIDTGNACRFQLVQFVDGIVFSASLQFAFFYRPKTHIMKCKQVF